jgi:hypothetical protein
VPKGSGVNLTRPLPIVLLALAACAPHAPRLELPNKVEASCEFRAVKQTGINAIVASTDDRPRSTPNPGDAALRAIVRTRGGAFAYWRDQLLYLPNTAKTIGVDGPYVRLKRAVITNEIDTEKRTRPVWFTLATPHGDVTVQELAFDVQDACIEGQRLP